MGLLISLEGNSFTGKSTAAKNLAAVLRLTGYRVEVFREPGGTPQGESLREQISFLRNNGAPEHLILDKVLQSRRMLVREKLKPLLEDPLNIVLVDRYVDSTLVYQGLIGGLDVSTLVSLNWEAVEGLMPKITYLFSFPEDQYAHILNRRRAMQSGERDDNVGDREGVEAQINRQRAFLSLPEVYAKQGLNYKRFQSINAAGTTQEVLNEMIITLTSRDLVSELLPRLSEFKLS